MPLVRIITRLAEYPTELVRDLRARGFDVELSVSGDERQKTAALEITFEQCSEENVSQSVADAMANKDVVIVANSQRGSEKIRSIGMVLLSSKTSLQTAHKTAVPAQFSEIYNALLHQRLGDHRIPSTFVANWGLRWEKIVLVTIQRASNSWKYCYAVGKNLNKFTSQTISEVVIWIESRKLSWRSRKIWWQTEHPEPDLVPSMFNLSLPEKDLPEMPAMAEKVVQGSIRSSKGTGFSLWKPATLGAVAVVTVVLLLHSFAPSSKANQIPSEEKNGINIEPPQTLVPNAQALSKPGKDDDAAASKVLAKSHPSDDEYFQEVVVRHFTQPPPKAVPKDGSIKRRVVVD